MSNERNEKVRIIAAFGDLTGFTRFDQEVTNDEVEFNPFFKVFDDVIQNAKEFTGYIFNNTGDGFFCSVDLIQGHNCLTVVNALTALWFIHKRIEHLIASTEPPKPVGFRIRLACGYIHRKVLKDGEIVDRGKHINLASHMLEVAKGIGVICTDTVKQLMSEKQIKKHGFIFERWVPDGKTYEGISQDQLQSMWIFRINDLSRRHLPKRRKR